MFFIEKHKKCRRNEAEEIFYQAEGPDSDDENGISD